MYRRGVIGLERGHPGPAHAVLNDREQGAIAERLDRRVGEIRHRRIHVCGKLGVSTPVRTVTAGTMRRKVIARRAPGVGVRRIRVDQAACRRWNRQQHQPPGDGGFDGAGCAVCRQTVLTDDGVDHAGDKDDEHDHGEHNNPKLPHLINWMQRREFGGRARISGRFGTAAQR